MNVINVKKLIRDNTRLNVSPKVIKEYSLRIVDHIIDNTYQLEKIAKKHGRKTILERDIIELFGYMDTKIAEGLYNEWISG